MDTTVDRTARGSANADLSGSADAPPDGGPGDGTDAPGGDERAPNIPRAVARGAAAGFVVVATLVSVLGILSQQDVGDALGMGVMAGAWGGSGFGAMLAAVRAGGGS